MKIIPVTGPGAVQDLSTPETVRTDRAKQAFNRGAPLREQPKTTAQSPVLDQNAISVEELGAIRAAPKAEIVENTEIEQPQDQEVTASAPEETKPAIEEQKPKDTPESRRWAQMVRQERALRAKAQQQEQSFKAREEALKAREAAIASKDQEYQQGYISKDQLKQDTLRILADSGISYDELTQQILNQSPRNPQVDSHIARLEAKIAQLEKANETNQESAKQQQQAQYDAAVKQIRQDAINLVKNDPNFETIKATGSVRDVVELITETYNKDGIVLSVEEAAEQVENYLVEEAMKLTRVGKIKQRLSQSNASAAKPQTQTPSSNAPKQTQMKTLTNAAGSTRQLTVRERAIAAMEGRLK